MLTMAEKTEIIEKAVEIYLPFRADSLDIARRCKVTVKIEDNVREGWSLVIAKVLKPRGIDPDSADGITLLTMFMDALVRRGVYRWKRTRR